MLQESVYVCMSAGVGSPDGPGEEVDGQFGGAWSGYTTKFLIHGDSTELRTVSSLALKCKETVKINLQWIEHTNMSALFYRDFTGVFFM